MESREIAALLVGLVTAAGILIALLYTTRDWRAERRAQWRGERFRQRKNEERIRAAEDH